MKIICVGMNYADHNKELNHSIGEVEGITLANDQGKTLSAPTLFLKPDTAFLRSDWPFYIPDFSNEVEYETELVVKINRLGKSIPERYAHRYYEEVTVGIDFTCRDLQRQLKAKGLNGDDRGGLLVQNEDGTKAALRSGEVSLGSGQLFSSPDALENRQPQ